MTRAVFEAVAGIGVLSVMDAIIKGLAAHFPTFQLAFARYLFGSLAILLLVAVVRPGWPSWETIRANGLRAVFVVSTAVTFFYALGTLPLAETLALSFLSPIFMAMFAALILKETIDRKIVSALVCGLAGMVVIVGGKLGQGSFDGSLLGVAAVLISAVTYALSMVLLRARAMRDPVVTIVAIQNVAPFFILLGPAGWVWTPAPAAIWGWFVLIGILGVGGHLLMARAFAKAEAARLAPLEYTALVWAVAIGLFAFGEVPTLATLAGALLIMAGAVIATRRAKA